MDLIIFFICLAPTIFQFAIGNRSKNESIKLPFEKVCAISYALQIVAGIISFYFATILAETKNTHCGMIFGGMIMLNIAFLVVITTTIVIQIFRYTY
jgi:hypothetical protein